MYLQTQNTLVTVILLDPLLFTLLTASDVIESAFLEAFADIRLWRRSPCLQRTQDVGFLFLFIKPDSKPFIENYSSFTGTSLAYVFVVLTLILRRSRTGTVWFCTSTSNKRAARPKLYTKSLTGDLKRMYSRFTLVRISINL